MSRPYAEVIGDPVAHSKSPLIHKFWLEKLGLDYDYRPTRVAAEALESFLEQRLDDAAWCGCNLTMPHKTAAAGLVAECVGPARGVGAMNCVVRRGSHDPRLVGSNTDVEGFLEPLRPWLEPGYDYLFADVLGTGGAAAAASYALRAAGFLVISYARTRAKAQAFRDSLGLDPDPDFALAISDLAGQRGAAGASDPNRLDLLVNATPLGMSGFAPLDIDLSGWSREVIVYDLVYAPVETELLRSARARGMPTIDGLAMLIGQAAPAFELFYEETAPREHDGELREVLTR
jgi:shikimate dehydrogenase